MVEFGDVKSYLCKEFGKNVKQHLHRIGKKQHTVHVVLKSYVLQYNSWHTLNFSAP